MQLLTTLYVADHRARVSSTGAALIVTSGDGRKSKVPLNALEAVVLLGHGQLTTDALAACVARRVRVVALTRTGSVRFVVGGATGGSVHLRLAQFRASGDADRVLAISRALVAGKLQNSRRLLQQWIGSATGLERAHLTGIADHLRERLARLPAARDPDHVRGIEGDAARLYFQGLGHHLDAAGVGLPFLSRTRRPPRDPVNALLSFAYTLLVGRMCGAVESVGLDPQVGFLHGLRPGRPALALDLIEELRPAYADRLVMRLLTRREMTAEDFAMVGGACYLSDLGRSRFIDSFESFMGEDVQHPLLRRTMPRQLVTGVQATLMARHLRGDIANYPPYLSVS